jgi:hypothetical protein
LADEYSAGGLFESGTTRERRRSSWNVSCRERVENRSGLSNAGSGHFLFCGFGRAIGQCRFLNLLSM